eukprot:4551190-Pleurochrysis_carterae.AAC.1
MTHQYVDCITCRFYTGHTHTHHQPSPNSDQHQEPPTAPESPSERVTMRPASGRSNGRSRQYS